MITSLQEPSQSILHLFKVFVLGGLRVLVFEGHPVNPRVPGQHNGCVGRCGEVAEGQRVIDDQGVTHVPDHVPREQREHQHLAGVEHEQRRVVLLFGILLEDRVRDEERGNGLVVFEVHLVVNFPLDLPGDPVANHPGRPLLGFDGVLPHGQHKEVGVPQAGADSFGVAGVLGEILLHDRCDALVFVGYLRQGGRHSWFQLVFGVVVGEAFFLVVVDLALEALFQLEVILVQHVCIILDLQDLGLPLECPEEGGPLIYGEGGHGIRIVFDAVPQGAGQSFVDGDALHDGEEEDADDLVSVEVEELTELVPLWGELVGRWKDGPVLFGQRGLLVEDSIGDDGLEEGLGLQLAVQGISVEIVLHEHSVVEAYQQGADTAQQGDHGIELYAADLVSRLSWPVPVVHTQPLRGPGRHQHQFLCAVDDPVAVELLEAPQFLVGDGHDRLPPDVHDALPDEVDAILDQQHLAVVGSVHDFHELHRHVVEVLLFLLRKLPTLDLVDGLVLAVDVPFERGIAGRGRDERVGIAGDFALVTGLEACSVSLRLLGVLGCFLLVSFRFLFLLSLLSTLLRFL